MPNLPPTVVGHVTGASLAIARLVGNYAFIPVDPTNATDDSRVVAVHIGDILGLAGTLKHLAWEWEQSPESDQPRASAVHLQAVAVEAGLERGVTPR